SAMTLSGGASNASMSMPGLSAATRAIAASAISSARSTRRARSAVGHSTVSMVGMAYLGCDSEGEREAASGFPLTFLALGQLPNDVPEYDQLFEPETQSRPAIDAQVVPAPPDPAVVLHQDGGGADGGDRLAECLEVYGLGFEK